MKVAYIKDRFIAFIDYTEREVPRKAGFLWDTDNLHWYTKDPLIAETMSRYCDAGAIGWIRHLKEQIQKNIRASASSEGKIKLYHPPDVMPRPYQVGGVEYMFPRLGTILADEQGLGKTAQALLLMNLRQNVEALIVCLSILKINWLREARKWLIGNLKVYIYDSQRIRVYEKRITSHNKTTTLHIINYDILKKHRDRLYYTPYNFFVGDEFHKAKNPEAERTKLTQELARKAVYKIFITGTPLLNKPKDLFVPLNLIDPARFINYAAFSKKYTGASPEEMNVLLRSNYMVRRLVDDVAKDLPKKMKDVIVLNEDSLAGIVEKEQRAVKKSKDEEERLRAEAQRLKELSQMDYEYEAAYKEKVKALRTSKMKNFGEIAKIRKELAIKKIPFVIEFVKEHLESSEDPMSKIVIFGHHTEVLQTIYKSLREYKPLLIIGATPEGERQRNIDAFSQRNDHRVFVGSMGATGTGVDGLQNNCNVAVFAELDWTPALIAQCESRLQRLGQRRPVWVYHIVADGSIDGSIAKLMVEKENMAKQILDYNPEQTYDYLLSTGDKLND